MRRIAVLLAVCWIAAGCSTFAVEPYARSEEIRGPWRADPLSVDPATVAAAEKACLDVRVQMGPDLTPADHLATIDARGGSRLTLTFLGPGSAAMECHLVMDAKANLAVAGGFVQDTSGPVVGPGEIVVIGAGGMTSSPESSSVSGHVGAAIAEVRVVFASGSVVRASIGGGWFNAWWPTHDMGFTVQGFDVTGRKVREVER